MIYLLLFIGGFCVAVYIAFQCLPQVISALDKINVVEVRAARAEGQNEVYQVMMTGLMQQNTGIVYAALRVAEEANRQFSPSPTQAVLPQYPQYQGTDGRTDEPEGVKSRIIEIKVCDSILKAGNISTTTDYIIFTRHLDGAVYRATRPYDDDEELNGFANDDGERLPYYTGRCQCAGCPNIFVTTKADTKNCDDKCRKRNQPK